MSGDEEYTYTDAKLEARIRRVVVEDPAAAPARIVKLIGKAYDEMSARDRLHAFKGVFLVDAALALLAAAGVGVLIGYLLWGRS